MRSLLDQVLEVEPVALEFLLVVPQLGDVARHAQHAGDLARRVADRHLDRVQQLAVAIAGESELLLAGERLPGLDHRAVAGDEPVGELAVDEVVVGAADNRGLGGTAELLEAGIAGEEGSRRVLEEDEVGNRRHQRAQPLLGGTQRGLGGLACGDVLGGRDDAAHLAVGGRPRPGLPAQPQDAAVGTHEAVLFLADDLAGEAATKDGQALLVDLREHLGVGLPDHLALAERVLGAPAPADGQVAEIGVEHGDRRRRVLDEQLEDGFPLAQPRFRLPALIQQRRELAADRVDLGNPARTRPCGRPGHPRREFVEGAHQPAARDAAADDRRGDRGEGQQAQRQRGRGHAASPRAGGRLDHDRPRGVLERRRHPAGIGTDRRAGTRSTARDGLTLAVQQGDAGTRRQREFIQPMLEGDGLDRRQHQVRPTRVAADRNRDRDDGAAERPGHRVADRRPARRQCRGGRASPLGPQQRLRTGAERYPRIEQDPAVRRREQDLAAERVPVSLGDIVELRPTRRLADQRRGRQHLQATDPGGELPVERQGDVLRDVPRGPLLFGLESLQVDDRHDGGEHQQRRDADRDQAYQIAR